MCDASGTIATVYAFDAVHRPSIGNVWQNVFYVRCRYFFLGAYMRTHILCPFRAKSSNVSFCEHTNTSYFSLSLGTRTFLLHSLLHLVGTQRLTNVSNRISVGSKRAIRVLSVRMHHNALPPSKIDVMIADKCFFTTYHSRATPLSAKRTSNDSSLFQRHT